jgi:hypothetical protein
MVVVEVDKPLPGDCCSTGEGGFEASGLGGGPELRRLRLLALSSRSSKVGFFVLAVSCTAAAAAAVASLVAAAANDDDGGLVSPSSLVSSIVAGSEQRPSKELLGWPRSRATGSATMEAGGGGGSCGGAIEVAVAVVVDGEGCEQD